MKERLKLAWVRRPRMGRGARIVKNLLLAALFLLYFWGVSGYDLPTRELERERAWRQNLLPAGTVMMEKETPDYTQVVTLDPQGLALGTWFDGARGRWDVLRYPRRQGAVAVIPLPKPVQTEAENQQIIYLSGMLAVGLPADAQTVWMDLTLDWGPDSRTWEALRGVRLLSGAYLFLYDQDALPLPASEEEGRLRTAWLNQLRAGEASGRWTVEVRSDSGSVWTTSGKTATIWGEETSRGPSIQFTQGH